MGPLFNKKNDNKWNLWVHEQCIYALFTAESNRKVNICGYCSMNSNRKTPTRVKTKKKKGTNTQSRKRKVENVEYKHTLKHLNVDISLIRPSTMIIQAFDDTRREVQGKIEITIEIGPRSFMVNFQVIEVDFPYNMLLGRPQ